MSTFKNLLSGISIMFFIYGCQNNNDKLKSNLYYANNYESLTGWCDNSLIVKGDAHSGKYSCRIDKNNVYGRGFVSLLKEISPTSLHGVKVVVWVKGESIKSEAVLVTEVRNPKDSIVFWQASETRDFVTEVGKWDEVTLKCHFPPYLDPQNIIKIYMMNHSDEVMLTDDLEIIFEN